MGGSTRETLNGFSCQLDHWWVALYDSWGFSASLVVGYSGSWAVVMCVYTDGFLRNPFCIFYLGHSGFANSRGVTATREWGGLEGRVCSRRVHARRAFTFTTLTYPTAFDVRVSCASPCYPASASLTALLRREHRRELRAGSGPGGRTSLDEPSGGGFSSTGAQGVGNQGSPAAASFPFPSWVHGYVETVGQHVGRLGRGPSMHGEAGFDGGGRGVGALGRGAAFRCLNHSRCDRFREAYLGRTC